MVDVCFAGTSELIRFVTALQAMSIIDSEAAFERKCKKLRNGDELYNGLGRLGVKDCSTLASMLGTQQKAPTDEQFEELGNKVYGTPTIGQLALLRKLHFKATALMVASINEQVKSDSSDPTSLSRRLPAAEKQSRLELQSKRLDGIRIVGELSPSHKLLALTNARVETGVLIWMASFKCSKRDDEVQANIESSPSTLQIEQATLKVEQVPVATVADVGSELKPQWALQRHGIAMDQCRLLDWSYHEDWAQWLLQSITKEVPSGPGAIKLEKVVRADKKLWTLLAQQQTKSLRSSNDVPMLNVDFRKLTTDPRVTMFVLHLPSSSRPVAAPKATPAPKMAAAPKNNPNKKQKVTRAEKNCPEELKKYTLRLEGKGNTCWSYNLSAGCSNTTSRAPAECMRGFDVCVYCHKPGHSVANCRSKPS